MVCFSIQFAVVPVMLGLGLQYCFVVYFHSTLTVYEFMLLWKRPYLHEVAHWNYTTSTSSRRFYPKLTNEGITVGQQKTNNAWVLYRSWSYINIYIFLLNKDTDVTASSMAQHDIRTIINKQSAYTTCYFAIKSIKANVLDLILVIVKNKSS